MKFVARETLAPTGDLITIIDRIEAVLLARFGVRRDRLTLVPDLSDQTRSGGTAAGAA